MIENSINNHKISIFTTMAESFTLLSCGCYTFAQKGEQLLNNFMLSLSVSGLAARQVYAPGGKLLESYDRKRDGSYPYTLCLRPPGVRLRFEFDANRENWVIVFGETPLEYQAATGRIWLNHRQEKIPLHASCRLEAAEFDAVRDGFRRIRTLRTAALPGDFYRSELIAGELVARLLPEPRPETLPPEQQLRLLIEQDVHCRKKLVALARQVGRHRDALRRRFCDAFGCTPGEYRDRLRLRQIADWMLHSDLSMKEIADLAGMKNVSHLNAFFGRLTGGTPGAYKRALRQNSVSPAPEKR